MFMCWSPARLWGSCDAPRMESEERRSLCARMLCSSPHEQILGRFNKMKFEFGLSHGRSKTLFAGWIRSVHHFISGHHRIWHASSILRGCVSVRFSELNICLIIEVNRLRPFLCDSCSVFCLFKKDSVVSNLTARCVFRRKTLLTHRSRLMCL